jgi:hypothetical protein
MRKLIRVSGIVASCFLILYVVLLVPGSEPTVPPSAPTQQAHAFLWSQDAYWDSLEHSFAHALRLGCNDVTPLITSATGQWRRHVDSLNLRSYQPHAGVFKDIEQLTFGLGPWIAVCPDQLPVYIDLVARTRDAVKRQSIGWDLNERGAREILIIIGKCSFLLGRLYGGSLIRVCGILPPCRQAGEWERGLRLKGVETGRRGARRASPGASPARFRRGRKHTSPCAAPAGSPRRVSWRVPEPYWAGSNR